MREARTLKSYFPMIRSREEIIKEISGRDDLRIIYEKWNEEQKNLFLDYCTGARGVKMLYDSFFKAILDPDTIPERLEELLSLILRQEVRILKVLPNESTRIGAENSLLIMDILVQLKDGSIANVECQRSGYAFPGQRAACYSADLLMRQYKRVRGEKGEAFTYRDIKKVYTIVFYKQSPKEFHDFSDYYIHRSRQKSDSGISLELLQEFIFIPIDIYFKFHHNKGIRNKLEAWLTFLGNDDPEIIMDLIEQYPKFRKMYEEVYELCLNTERVMEMFSKELQELDKNTVQYMIDDMQDTIDEQKKQLASKDETIDEQKVTIDEQKKQLASKDETIDEQKKQLADRDTEIQALKKRLAEHGIDAK